MAHHLQQLKWYYFMTSTRILECEKCAIIDINTSHRCYLLAFMILNVVNTFSIGNRRTDVEEECARECKWVLEWGCRKRERENRNPLCWSFQYVAFVHTMCSMPNASHITWDRLTHQMNGYLLSCYFTKTSSNKTKKTQMNKKKHKRKIMFMRNSTLNANYERT